MAKQMLRTKAERGVNEGEEIDAQQLAVHHTIYPKECIDVDIEEVPYVVHKGHVEKR